MGSNKLTEFLLKRINFLIKIAIPPIIILIIHFILSLNYIYFYINWINMPMHFFGGVSIGITYTLLLMRMKKDQYIGDVDKIMMFIFIISMTGLTTILWEFFEFGSDQLFGTTMQPSLADTITDIFLGLMGGTLSSLTYMNHKSLSNSL